MNIETAEDAIEAWKAHDGWEFADREAAWKWMFAQGRQAGRLDEREECALLCEWLAKDDDVPAGSIADAIERIMAYVKWNPECRTTSVARAVGCCKSVAFDRLCRMEDDGMVTHYKHNNVAYWSVV